MTFHLTLGGLVANEIAADGGLVRYLITLPAIIFPLLHRSIAVAVIVTVTVVAVAVNVSVAISVDIDVVIAIAIAIADIRQSKND